MKNRILKRKVIIREYDYEKAYNKAFAPLSWMGISDTLYDRANFTLLNYEFLEKLKIVEILKGKQHTPLIKPEWNFNIPTMILFDLKDYLYNVNYINWKVTVDDNGYICVQARKNTPNSRLGFAVFEKDLESRI
jgi:hypothetical protein